MDGYAAYDQLFRSGRMVRVGCWAHARRYFVKAEDTAIDLATAMIGMIRVLYRIEDQARDLPPAERQALRQRESVPMLRMIKEWLDAKSREVLPKSPIGEAITYTLGQWEALQAHASDGRLDIDNNATEKRRPSGRRGRKNWLFFAGEAGGQRAAVLFSLVTSCKELGVDPYAYLADVLDKVSVVPVSRIHELTPLGWKQAREVNAVGASRPSRPEVTSCAGGSPCRPATALALPPLRAPSRPALCPPLAPPGHGCAVRRTLDVMQPPTTGSIAERAGCGASSSSGSSRRLQASTLSRGATGRPRAGRATTTGSGHWSQPDSPFTGFLCYHTATGSHPLTAATPATAATTIHAGSFSSIANSTYTISR